jgi:PleD family two-component response regulator
MPDTDLAQAEVAVNRLGWWLEKWNSSEQREYRLGISCGVAAYQPETTVEDVIKAADADLYVQKAKRIDPGQLPRCDS